MDRPEESFRSDYLSIMEKPEDLEARSADPYHFNSDPDPASYFNADPDLAPLRSDGNLRPLAYRPSRAPL
jgi:hypothetical protein